MAALPDQPLMTVEEYLGASFPEGDREYVDGAVVERELGTPWHSILQGILIEHLRRYQRDFGMRVMPECRTRVSEARFRIPDVAVMQRPFRMNRQVILDPPFLVIEVLSPADRLTDVLDRFRDYEAFGVRHIVLMDPVADKSFVYASGNLIERHLSGFEVPDRGTLPFDSRELFAVLDEERRED